MTLSIMAEHCYTVRHLCLVSLMLIATYTPFMLNVVMLIVVAPTELAPMALLTTLCNKLECLLDFRSSLIVLDKKVIHSALLANVRLEQECLPSKNTLAYY
jgi:hypothetical protein